MPMPDDFDISEYDLDQRYDRIRWALKVPIQRPDTCNIGESTVRNVLVAMVNHMGQEGTIYVSLNTLEQELTLAMRSIRQAIDVLKSCKVLIPTGKHGKSNAYLPSFVEGAGQGAGIGAGVPAGQGAGESAGVGAGHGAGMPAPT